MPSGQRVLMNEIVNVFTAHINVIIQIVIKVASDKNLTNVIAFTPSPNIFKNVITYNQPLICTADKY